MFMQMDQSRIQKLHCIQKVRLQKQLVVFRNWMSDSETRRRIQKRQASYSETVPSYSETPLSYSVFRNYAVVFRNKENHRKSKRHPKETPSETLNETLKETLMKP